MNWTDVVPWLLPDHWTTAVVAWIGANVFSYVDGEVDGRHMDRPISVRQSLEPDIHGLFVTRRVVLFFMTVLAAGAEVAISWALMFAFIHDGAYYFTRRRLDERLYPDGWRSAPSKTSTAKQKLHYKDRLLLMYLGLILFILTVIISSLHLAQ